MYKILSLLLCSSFLFLVSEVNAKGTNDKKFKDVYSSYNKKIRDLAKQIKELQKKKEEEFKKDQEKLFKKIEKVKKQLAKAKGNKRKSERIEKELKKLEDENKELEQSAELPNLKLGGGSKSSGGLEVDTDKNKK